MDTNSSSFNFRKPLNKDSSISKVVAVMSGKGGVGKSSVSSLIAKVLCDGGNRVGILDADITGPSIMKIFGLEGERAEATEKGAIPLVSSGGVKVMSIQALIEKSDEAAIWRGPIISGVVQQFWTDVIWGDLDYLIIDMPPGTADIPLTVMQSIPLDAIVVVTSPQELVELIVKKSVNMAKTMNTRIAGIIENMSYMICSHCNNKLFPFGESRIKSAADDMEIDVLGKLPIDTEFVKACDKGKIDEYNGVLKESLKDIYKYL